MTIYYPLDAAVKKVNAILNWIKRSIFVRHKGILTLGNKNI